MESKYHNFNSLSGKIRVVLVLIGILPFLLVIYQFVDGKIDLTVTISLFSALALFSILTGFSLLRKSADQLANLARETSTIKDHKYQEGNKLIKIKADQELNDIANHFNTMLKKINDDNKIIKDQDIQLIVYARDISRYHKKTKEEEKLRNRLCRYVGVNLMEKLINSKSDVFFENERKEVTVLFADIRHFSSLAENMVVEEVVSMLNQFFGTVVDIIFRNNGILDKFLGDQLMAVFGAISSGNTAPYDAIKASIEMQVATENLMKVRTKQDKETFEIGIGINTGTSILGNVGSKDRMDYTVIGNSVNIAATLQQIAGGGEIIIGEKTYRQIQDRFHIQKKGQIKVKYRTDPVIYYEVLR
jgi:class 3 adenylate cyclase